MVAYIYNMPSGFAGSLSRWEHATAEGQQINTTSPPLTYGQVVVMDAATGTVRQPTTADTAGFYGLNARAFQTQGYGVPPGSLNDPIGPASPPTVGEASVMRRGYMLVKLGGVTAAVKGAQAQVWTGASAGQQVQGNITAVAPAAGTSVILPGAMFMSGADANGMVEISYNI